MCFLKSKLVPISVPDISPAQASNVFNASIPLISYGRAVTGVGHRGCSLGCPSRSARGRRSGQHS